jgi:hypothetical protein
MEAIAFDRTSYVSERGWQGFGVLNLKKKPARMTVEEVLKKRESEFKNWSYGVDTEILPKACPVCKSDMVCGYAEMHPTDYCDTYQHLCMNPKCHFHVEKDYYGVGMGGREFGPDPCPFCGRKV